MTDVNLKGFASLALRGANEEAKRVSASKMAALTSQALKKSAATIQPPKSKRKK